MKLSANLPSTLSKFAGKYKKAGEEPTGGLTFWQKGEGQAIFFDNRGSNWKIGNITKMYLFTNGSDYGSLYSKSSAACPTGLKWKFFRNSTQTWEDAGTDIKVEEPGNQITYESRVLAVNRQPQN